MFSRLSRVQGVIKGHAQIPEVKYMNKGSKKEQSSSASWTMLGVPRRVPAKG